MEAGIPPCIENELESVPVIDTDWIRSRHGFNKIMLSSTDEQSVMESLTNSNAGEALNVFVVTVPESDKESTVPSVKTICTFPFFEPMDFG